MSSKSYNFKSITVVPAAKDFVDIVLSKTQRKTPTVVHKGYAISRIRGFYTRKVKYTQQNFHDKLKTIIDEFPKLNDIHPFYADLINVLYDKDHYKLALGQVNVACHMVDNIAKDYVRLLKYGDSLYRCKQLKRAALGRMCTLMRRLKTSLAYLEQVRQHLSRLPSIDPNTRTLLLTGFPNVGKSSFVNRITRADVEVQPYAFTTKSLFVGHTDYQYLRWQVIDTPGILDHPLENRNTIEMQAITALAHLRACVLYVMDLSEQCDFTVEQQFSLFENIKPLFSNKPLVIVINKIDTCTIDDIAPEHQERLREYERSGVTLCHMSTLTGDGVGEAKTMACEKLLADRIEMKSKNPALQGNINALRISLPKPRDEKDRPAFVPAGAEKKRMGRVATKGRSQRVEKKQRDEMHKELHGERTQRTLQRDLQAELREDFSVDLRAEWDLLDPEWRYDSIPEIVDGKNVADFVDPDIMEKLEELEREEEEREAAGEYDSESEDDETKVIRARANVVRQRRKVLHMISQKKRTRNAPVLPKKARQRLEIAKYQRDAERKARRIANNDNDMDEDDDYEGRRRSSRRDRERSPLRDEEDDVGNSALAASLRKNASGTTSQSLRELGGVQTKALKKKADSLQKLGFRQINYQGKQGEADRRIQDKMPKHLFSGKRGRGKTDRR